jgi:hypothetical protein
MNQKQLNGLNCILEAATAMATPADILTEGLDLVVNFHCATVKVHMGSAAVHRLELTRVLRSWPAAMNRKPIGQLRDR